MFWALARRSFLTGIEAPGQVYAGTILTLNNDAGLTVATCDNKIIRLDILFINGNFMPGNSLAVFGLLPGIAFDR